jgi:hypothetical protein
MRRAIIVGGGAKARSFPFGLVDADDTTEIWGINFMKKDWIPRWDRMFNIHRYELLKKYGYPTWMDAEANIGQLHWARVFLADKWPDNRMHDAEIFPADELRRLYPRGDYHCNSLDWLIHYAQYEGFNAIHLHGFNLEREGVMEQMSAAKCAEYWAGYVTGRGMEVHVGEDSSLFGVYHLALTNRVYGYDDCPAWEDRRPGAKDPPYRYDDH